MKPSVFPIVCMIAAICWLTACAGPQSPAVVERPALSRLVRDIQKAVVTVQTLDDEKRPMKIGTGFFISDDGLLVTNHHVMDGAYAASVKTHAGETYSISAVVAEDRLMDLVKVAVDIPAVKVDKIRLADTLPQVADRIFVVGSPLGLEQTVSEGIVSAIREFPAVDPIFQITAPISQGSSGSPVMNMSGQVIGVVSFQSATGQNLNFAVAAGRIAGMPPMAHPQSVSEWTYAHSKQKPEVARELCQKGFNFSIRGEYKEALTYYREAVEANPEDTIAWFGLGSCYVGLERPLDAVAAYKQAIQTDPQNPSVHYNLGRYYNRLERYEEAIAAFEEAVRIDPDHIPAHFDMGLSYSKLGRYNDEKQSYETIIDIDPEFFPAHHRVALAYIKLGRYENAVDAVRRALRIKPDFAPAHYTLGIALGNLGRRNAEMQAYKKAIRFDPDYVPAHYNMGLWYLNRNDKAAALGQYKIIRNLDDTAAQQLFDLIYESPAAGSGGSVTPK